MAYYILGTSLIDGNEESTWKEICTRGLGIDQSEMDKGARLSVEKERFRSATVDILIGLTDVMQKLDLNLEGIIKKVEKQRRDLEAGWDASIITNAGSSIFCSA